MLGTWDVNVSVGSMPQKVASAVSALSETLIGTMYTPIAYLGSQVVNGINHAVLAEQTVLAGKDTTNIVLMIFNEKGTECALTNIERVLESGNGFGGIDINVQTEINSTAQSLFDRTFEYFCGSTVTPFALLGTQVVKGLNYIFACTVKNVTEDANEKVVLVTINDLSLAPQFTYLLDSNARTNTVDTAKQTLRLSSPWNIFYKKVAALFAQDPEVTVLYNDEEPELKLWVKGNNEKASALNRFLTRQKEFGNVLLNMSVVGDDGNPVNDINCTTEEALRIAFKNNDALSFIHCVETMFKDRVTYVVFRKTVVQYFCDNMMDIHGVKSTLYEDIARDVFEGVLDNNMISFCTDTYGVSLGKPLGEWP